MSPWERPGLRPCEAVLRRTGRRTGAGWRRRGRSSRGAAARRPTWTADRIARAATRSVPTLITIVRSGAGEAAQSLDPHGCTILPAPMAASPHDDAGAGQAVRGLEGPRRAVGLPVAAPPVGQAGLHGPVTARACWGPPGRWCRPCCSWASTALIFTQVLDVESPQGSYLVLRCAGWPPGPSSPRRSNGAWCRFIERGADHPAGALPAGGGAGQHRGDAHRPGHQHRRCCWWCSWSCGAVDAAVGACALVPIYLGLAVLLAGGVRGGVDRRRARARPSASVPLVLQVGVHRHAGDVPAHARPRGARGGSTTSTRWPAPIEAVRDAVVGGLGGPRPRLVGGLLVAGLRRARGSRSSTPAAVEDRLVDVVDGRARQRRLLRGGGKRYRKGRERTNLRAAVPGPLGGPLAGRDPRCPPRPQLRARAGSEPRPHRAERRRQEHHAEAGVQGHRPGERAHRRARRTASLIELGAGFHPDMTGRENAWRSAPRCSGWVPGPSAVPLRPDRGVLRDLRAHLDTPVKRYSSGMLARLGFSVATHLEAEVLVLDEVLAVGDAGSSAAATSTHRRGVRRRRGAPLRHTTRCGRCPCLCEQAILLSGGNVAAPGTPIEVISAYERLQAEGVIADGATGRLSRAAQGHDVGSHRRAGRVARGEGRARPGPGVPGRPRAHGAHRPPVAQATPAVRSTWASVRAAGPPPRRSTIEQRAVQPGTYELHVGFVGDYRLPAVDDMRSIRIEVEGAPVDSTLGLVRLPARWTTRRLGAVRASSPARCSRSGRPSSG